MCIVCMDPNTDTVERVTDREWGKDGERGGRACREKENNEWEGRGEREGAYVGFGLLLLPSGRLADLFIRLTRLSLLRDFAFVQPPAPPSYCIYHVWLCRGVKQAWHIQQPSPPPPHHTHNNLLEYRPPPPTCTYKPAWQWIPGGRLIWAIVLMYVALSPGCCVPTDNVSPTRGPFVPFEIELGKYPIYRPSNNGLVFPYKC